MPTTRRISPDSAVPRGIRDAAEKPERPPAPVADREEEGMIGTEYRGAGGEHTQPQSHPDRRGGCGLGSLLVHVRKRLVVDRGDEQCLVMRRLVAVDAREVSLGSIERNGHAKRCERLA